MKYQTTYQPYQTPTSYYAIIWFMVLLLIGLIVLICVFVYKKKKVLLKAKCTPCILKVKELKNTGFIWDYDKVLCKECKDNREYD